MKRPAVDLLAIVALYLIYWGGIILADMNNLPDMLGAIPVSTVTGPIYRDHINYWADIVLGVSGFMMIAWYVLGEWGPRAHRTPSWTWALIWFVLLALVLGASTAATLTMGPETSEGMGALAALFFCGGIITFWLASVCFSPIGIKYIVFPAKWVRFW
jgi:hypothetical protein